MNFDAVGGRRYLLTWGCVAVSSFMLWFDKVTGGEWVTIIIATAAAYIAGNTAQKFKSIGADHERNINESDKVGDRENRHRY